MLGSLMRDWLNKHVFFPLGKRLSCFDPNHVTAWAYPLAFIAAYFIFVHAWLWAALFVILSSVVDNIDGAIAKANNKKTLFGSYWDAFTDKVQEVTILAGFALAGYPTAAFFAAVLSLLVAFAKARAEMVVPLGNPDWPAIGERAERLLIVFFTLLFRPFWPSCCGFDLNVVGLYVLAAIALIGLIQRFSFARELLAKADAEKQKNH